MRKIYRLAIVIPAYKPDYLFNTLQSIYSQSCKDFNLYIGDDCSPYDLKQITDKTATALNMEIGVENIDKNLFLNKLLKNFCKNYHEFLDKGFKLIKCDYEKRANFLGKQISISMPQGKISGVAKSVTDSGGLVILTNNTEILLNAGYTL